MPDVVIAEAIKNLRKRRDEIETGIRTLESLNGDSTHSSRLSPAAKKATGRKGRPMSLAVKARLRAAYAARHPGWKPKKK